MRIVALALVVATAAGACGHSDGIAPPDIAYGRDICIDCGMIISDPRFAAAYEYEGVDRLFDDIGGMLRHGLDSGELTPSTPAWVHDHDTGEWVDARSARFVHAEGLTTPMGDGLAAFTSASDAEAHATLLGGEVLTWFDLLTGHRTDHDDQP